MTVRFKTTETEVTIKTEWNTLHQFFDQEGKIRPLRSTLALGKYNLYQRTSGLRDATARAERVLAVLRDDCRPCVVAAYVAAWVRFKTRKATAPVRHYVGIIRVSRKYSL